MIIAVPVLLLAPMPGFALRWIWYISAAAVVVQLAMNLWLLRREFRIRLSFDAITSAHAPSSRESTAILSS
jgi:hypothetical protein